MVKFLFFALFCLGNIALYAQNWECVYPNDTTFFLDEKNNILAFTPQAIDYTTNYNRYFPYPNFASDTSCTNNGGYGFNANAPIWIGRLVVHTPNDGRFAFINNQGDSVVINSKASLGDSWVFYIKGNDTLWATVVAIDTATVLGNIDSIKTITLAPSPNVLDNNITKWNNKELVISKNSGLVYTPKFLGFPRDTVCANISALRPLTYGDVYRYEVGDYFQIKRQMNFDFNMPNTLSYFEVLQKQSYPLGDSVTYTFHREVNTTIDTVVVTYRNLSHFVGTNLPGKPELNTTGTQQTAPLYVTNMAVSGSNDTMLGGRRSSTIHHQVDIETVGGYCWQWNGTFDGAEIVPTYYECLGVLEYLGVVNGYYRDRVVYYNLCGVKKGEKQLVGVEDVNVLEPTLFPNPATTIIEITNPNYKTMDVMILSLQGKLLGSIHISPYANGQLDVSHLSAGMYVVKSQAGQSIFCQKLIIRQ